MHSVSLAGLAASWERWEQRRRGSPASAAIAAVCAAELAAAIEAPEQLAGARARHTRRQPPPDSGAAHCTTDGQDWPCDFTVLADLVWGEVGELPCRAPARNGDGSSEYQHPCPGCGDLVATGEEIAHARDCGNGTAPWPDGYRWCGERGRHDLHLFTRDGWLCPGFPLWRRPEPFGVPDPGCPTCGGIGQIPNTTRPGAPWARCPDCPGQPA